MIQKINFRAKKIDGFKFIIFKIIITLFKRKNKEKKSGFF